MLVFLNDRRIRLMNHPPLFVDQSCLTASFLSTNQIRELYGFFENDSKISELIIWSEKKYKKMCKHFLSLFTRIEAAGGLVENDEGHFLFIYRFERWDLPKGKIDKKDCHSARKAAIREVKEETGLKKIRITAELPETWHIYRQKEHLILKHTSWFRMYAHTGQTLKPQHEEGILTAQWKNKEELDQIMANTYASLREMIQSSSGSQESCIG